MTNFNRISKLGLMAVTVATAFGAQISGAPNAAAYRPAPPPPPVVLRCPTRNVDEGIPPIMGGKWQLPWAFNRLENIRIDHRRGLKRLICRYSGGEEITKKQPRGWDCRVDSRRKFFLCYSSSGHSGFSNEWRSGNIDLKRNQTTDLDGGRLSPRYGSDIWYRVSRSGNRYIMPENDTRLSLGSGQFRNERQCRRERLSSGSIAIRSLRSGDYICMRTSSGRIGRFQVTKHWDRGEMKLYLRYVVWER